MCEQEADYKCDVCGTPHKVAGRDLWCRLFLISSAYYDFTVRAALGYKGNRRGSLPKGFNLNVMGDFQKRQHSSISVDILSAHVMFSAYLPLMFSAHFTEMFRAMTPQLPQLSTFEHSAHNSLPSLLQYSRTAPHADLRYAASILTEGVLFLLRDTYSEERVAWDNHHIPGPFSAINLRELSLIAKRDARVVKRYGAKQVEKVFEHQLALLFQSLGFYVVSTRLGHRTVDLICISAIDNEPITLLVEAKTSGKPYALPVSDQRALMEYVGDVRKSLNTIPPPCLILLVGQEPAKSMEDRLRSLEAAANTPIRYIRAAELAALRESIPGPIHPNVLRQTFVQSKSRILVNPGKPIAAHERRLHDANRAYVHALLQSGHDLASHPWALSEQKAETRACQPSLALNSNTVDHPAK